MLSTYLAPELFASIDPLLLAGSQCGACGRVDFPVSRHCLGCGAGGSTPINLPRHGTVWSWTVQRFAPKPPYRVPEDGFAPFAVGYVDLGPVIVEALLECDLDRLAIGDPVELVSHRLSGPDNVLSYAFRARS